MVKLFTVMYIVCAIYSSNPGVVDPDIPSSVADIVFTYETGGQLLDSTSKENDDNEITISDYLEELKKLGFYKDEYKDAELNKRNAVIRFQSDHNIPISGVWDDQSMNALKKRIRDIDFKHPDKINESPTNKKWITINKTTRILTLYEGTKVMKKYPVAVGNPPSLTPSGKVKICSKIINPAWGGGGYAKPVPGGSPNNPLGYRWMGLSIKDGTRYGIHGNNSPYSIGKNVSHGCIRMINSDVEELFKLIEISTDVWIGTESELKKWGVTQEKY
jgi:lipoprotein-anchoring transpeptidase ErfK/SrfK